jgi:ferric-dicitrate binding protein FerR (iron transport regulator)
MDISIMEKEEYIGLHIVEYLLNGGDGNTDDPVLAEWLATSESNKIDLMKYKKIWDSSRYFTQMEQFDREIAWEKIHAINQRKEQFRKRLTYIYYITSGAAAAVLLFLALSYMGFKDDATVDVSMTANYGSRSEIVLPDGSKVKLNAGSTIRYAFDRKNNLRNLDFKGEGFFDVAKSKSPFVITMANGVQVKVLGTTFNLCAYEEDRTVQAALLEGNIELSHGAGKLNLKTGEMAVYDKETNELKKENGIPAHAYGWVNNKIYMDYTSLAEVCKKLERCYNVKITLSEDIGETIHYDGVLQEESITDVLKALTKLSKIKYTVNGKNIKITSK